MHFSRHSEDFCVSFVMFSGVTEVQFGGFIGDSGFEMTQHHCHRDSLGYKFSHSSCSLILGAYMISSQNFQTHYFSLLVGPLRNFPIFSLRNFNLVTRLSFDFWDFIYIPFSIAQKEISTEEAHSQTENKHPQSPGTGVTKQIKVCLKCIFNQELGIPCRLLNTCYLSTSSPIFYSHWKKLEDSTLESIHITRNGEVNLITFPVKIVLVITNLPSHFPQFHGMLLTTYFLSPIHQYILKRGAGSHVGLL